MAVLLSFRTLYSPLKKTSQVSTYNTVRVETTNRGVSIARIKNTNDAPTRSVTAYHGGLRVAKEQHCR
jgi:hypothetical protein